MRPSARQSADAAVSRRVTIKDVARHAGVGTGTVSRVLNQGAHVSDRRRAAVLAAVEELGYVRDSVARELRSGTSGTVGLLVEDVADPFYSQLHRALESALLDAGFALLAVSSDGSSTPVRRLLEELASRRVEGLVVTLPMDVDEDALRTLAARGVRVVFVDRPAGSLDADSVRTDSRLGARLAVEHLLSRGHRRIAAMLDHPRRHSSGERLLGALEAIAAAGLPEDALVVSQQEPDDDGARALLARMLDAEHPPTALLTGNNRTTLSALRALRALGVRLDHVGIDDLELADLLDPPLTVIAQDPAAMGAVAAGMLVERIRGLDEPAREVLLEPRLIVR